MLPQSLVDWALAACRTSVPTLPGLLDSSWVSWASSLTSDTAQWGTDWLYTEQSVPTLPEASGVEDRAHSAVCPNTQMLILLSLLLKGSLFLLTVVLCLVVCLWLRAHCPGAAAALPLGEGVVPLKVENGMSCLQADCLPWLPFIPSPVGSF